MFTNKVAINSNSSSSSSSNSHSTPSSSCRSSPSSSCSLLFSSIFLGLLLLLAVAVSPSMAFEFDLIPVDPSARQFGPSQGARQPHSGPSFCRYRVQFGGHGRICQRFAGLRSPKAHPTAPTQKIRWPDEGPKNGLAVGRIAAKRRMK